MRAARQHHCPTDTYCYIVKAQTSIEPGFHQPEPRLDSSSHHATATMPGAIQPARQNCTCCGSYAVWTSALSGPLTAGAICQALQRLAMRFADCPLKQTALAALGAKRNLAARLWLQTDPRQLGSTTGKSRSDFCSITVAVSE